jgi:hypothetical protein
MMGVIAATRKSMDLVDLLSKRKGEVDVDQLGQAM